MPGRVSLWARTDDEVRTRGPGRQEVTRLRPLPSYALHVDRGSLIQL